MVMRLISANRGQVSILELVMDALQENTMKNKSVMNLAVKRRILDYVYTKEQFNKKTNVLRC